MADIKKFKYIPKDTSLKAIVIGTSAGGIDALGKILQHLPRNYPIPIIIVIHMPGNQVSLLAELFQAKSQMRVKDAEEKETIVAGTIYFAPPGYHLLIEHDLTFSLSTEDPVQYSRPAIDVLFESAADALGSTLLGVLLTGANRDGAFGLKRIQDCGGLALVQDPSTAFVRSMPDAGCASISASFEQILSLEEIARFLMRLGGRQSKMPVLSEERKRTNCL